MGEAFPNSEPVAKNLVKLLAPPKPKETATDDPSGFQPNYTAPPSEEVTTALIAALEQNTTVESRKLLVQLLRGNLPTHDDKRTVELVLKTLAANPARNGDLLFQVMTTQAGKLRPPTKPNTPEDPNVPPGQAPITAGELRQMTFDLIKENASLTFREELAHYVTQRTTAKDQRDLFWEFLKEDRPENVGAQLIIYRGPQTEAATKQELQGYFANYGSRAMGLLLGAPASPADSGMGGNDYSNPPPPNYGTSDYSDPTQQRKPDPDLPYHLADKLWSPEFVAMVETALAADNEGGAPSSLLQLARTIPIDSTRAAVWQTLQERFIEGPTMLDSANAGQTLVNDPGFLFALKSLRVKSASFRIVGRIVGRDVRMRLPQAKLDWDKRSLELADLWCRRFHEAATGSAETAEGAPAGPAADQSVPTLPILLHKDAKVTTSYQAIWPNDVKAKLTTASLSPIVMKYVRIEETASRRLRWAFYRRQLRVKAAIPTEKGDWAESFQIVPETDRRAYISILISSADAQQPVEQTGQPAEEENLVIQILLIEMKDPGVK